jgi:hypothetical protein
VEQKRISRRELLRSIGIAGAVGWATPVITSSRAVASVDRCSKRRARRLCKGTPCNCDGQSWLCGACSSDVGDGSYCFVRFGNLRCICAEDVFCSEAGTCITDADCKAQSLGNICLTANGCTGCGTSKGVCSTRCCLPPARLAAPARKPRRLGRTASRR